MGNQVFVSRPRYAIIGALICVSILSLGYFNNPPNGYTGAPGDSLCTECHSLGSGMQDGNILINGFPSTIIADQTYTLTVTVANPNGLADFAGFQSVVLDAGNQNSGTLSNPSSGSTIQTQGGRTYHEHNPAQMFVLNAVSWTVDWTAPMGSGLVTIYAAGNVANGNGNDNGDLIVTTSSSGTLMTPLQVEITDVQDVTCFGFMDGSLTADATFGAPDYTYAWSNGGSGPTISGLGPGDYTVTVTDMDGATATASAEILEPVLFEIVSVTITHVSCNGGSDGSIVLILDGGTMPYNGTQGDIATYPDLVAGDYTVMITDANGCLISEEYTITEPPPLTIELTVIIEPDCAGEATGLISVEGSGGTGEIEYAWSNGSTSSTNQNLEAGTYTVTITDANGCVAEEEIQLGEPEFLFVDLLMLEQVSCAGAADGAISVDATGGTGDVQYQWSNGASSPTITGLEPGDYAVTVTDENGCTDVGNYTITEPAPLAAGISGTASVDCFGDSTGTLTIQAGGGIPAYSYSWSTGSTSDVLTGLSAGTYQVTVTDNNGCTVTASAVITQPDQIMPNVITIGESAPGAMDGTATASPTGGTGSYIFLWSTGDTTAVIAGLSAGMYTVTVTDENACSATQTVAVTGVNCTLVATVATSNAFCFGEASGTAQISVTGAMGSADILWSTGDTTQQVSDLPAGMYSVTVTDSAGCLAVVDFSIGQPVMLSSVCTTTGETMDGANDGTIACTASGGVMPFLFNWSNGDTTANISGLVPGTYIVTITDANGCTISDTAIVNAFSCTLALNVSITHVLCFGDSTGIASIAITGGTPPFQISWSNGSSGTSIDSVPAGMYNVEVMDAEGCVSETIFEVGQPAAITVNVDTVIQSSQGVGGAIQITITGGTPPYATVWKKDGVLISTNEDITDLSPGEYDLEIADANDCMLAIGTLTVTVSTGIRGVANESKIRLWPNPVSDFFNLSVEGSPQMTGGFIYSSEGKLIRKLTSTDFAKGGEIVRIHIRDLSTGLYYLDIVTAHGRQMIPFVKM